MTFGRRLAASLACAAALLAGCASPGPRTDVAGETIAGRMALKVAADAGAPARGVNAGFELSGDAVAGRLDLATPIGTLLARAQWAPGRVVLTTPEGETTYPDLAALTRELLGEELPLAAWFDWLRGRPWPGAPSAVLDAADGPGFAQLGWRVGLARYGEGVVSAWREQAPAVTVQVRLDRSAAEASAPP